MKFNITIGFVYTFILTTLFSCSKEPDFNQSSDNHRINSESITAHFISAGPEVFDEEITYCFENPTDQEATVTLTGTYVGNKEYTDKQGHGTHCAGIAAAAIPPGDYILSLECNGALEEVNLHKPEGHLDIVNDWSETAEIIIQFVDQSEINVTVESGASLRLGGPSSSKAIEDAVKTAISNQVCPKGRSVEFQHSDAMMRQIDWTDHTVINLSESN